MWEGLLINLKSLMRRTVHLFQLFCSTEGVNMKILLFTVALVQCLCPYDLCCVETDNRYTGGIVKTYRPVSHVNASLDRFMTWAKSAFLT